MNRRSNPPSATYRILLRPGYIVLHGGTAGMITMALSPLVGVAIATQLGGGNTLSDIFTIAVFVAAGLAYVVATAKAIRDIEAAKGRASSESTERAR